MAAVLQTTFSHVFSRMKMYEFSVKFDGSLFLAVQFTMSALTITKVSVHSLINDHTYPIMK